MSAPVFPLAFPKWESPQQFKADPRITQFSKGGMSHRLRIINGTNLDWMLIFQIQDATLYQEVEDFLKERSDKSLKPFRFNYRANSFSTLYTCSNWQWTIVGTSLWQLDATFKRVYRFVG